MRTILIVALSLVFGLSAAIGTARILSGALQPRDTVGVVIAKSDLPRFTSLTADDLTTKQYPKDLVPPGAATNVEDVVGRVTETALVKDEALLESKLAPKGAGRGMAAVIPPGKRAVTIRTPNVATGVAGFILPGNKVDVMFTRQTNRADDPTGGGATRTLVPNVEILAVDQRIEAPTEHKVDTKELKSVTLLVTPQQAAEIDLAQTVGTLHLALRNPLDTDMSKFTRVTLKEIETGQYGVSAEDLAKLVAGIMNGAATTEPVKAPAPVPEVAPEPRPVAVAPPPTPVPEKPVAPVQPPRIRTLRGGIPGTVVIE